MSEEEKQYWRDFYKHHLMETIAEEKRKKREKKPVVDVDAHTMWNYEYQAKHIDGSIIASNSLLKLKEEIKRRGWQIASLTCTEGCFSSGQYCVDEYLYRPNYNRK